MLIMLFWLMLLTAHSVHAQQTDDDASVSPQEIDALYDFYIATNGPTWQCDEAIGILWDFSEPDPNPCADKWIGIWCYWDSSDDGYKHISSLSLGYCSMYGTIPESIANLTLLTEFQLNNNHLTMSIPSSITSLVELDTINLEYNQLTGTIPWDLTSLVLLQMLFLDNNQLHGTIPSDIGLLNKTLLTLQLSTNQFTGTIPPSLYDLTLLNTLDLSYNGFNGTVSSGIGRLAIMGTLWLTSNHFTGTLPSAAFCDMDVAFLYIDYNHFLGTLPECIGIWSSVNTLRLSRNAFIGSIPDSFVNLTDLMEFAVEYNQLTGTLPEYIGSVIGPSLYLLNLANNLFHGSIHDSYCNMPQLYNLFLGSNHLTGTIPSCFDGDHFPYVFGLNISNNHLHGGIANITTIPQLNVMAVNNNLLSGTLSEKICELKRGNVIHLQSNQLEGELYPCMMTLFNAGELWIQNNQFTGRLPDNEWYVEVIDVSNNYFTGPPVFVVDDLARQISLTFSDNLLSGTLPYNWNNYTNLLSLFISNNLMSGPLDTFFVENRAPLMNIDLSHNHFTGTLPPHLFSIPSLQSFAAVSNCLHGALPAAQMCSLVNLSTLALDGLMSSTHCQDRLLPYSSSYQIQHTVTGGVPPCLLYSMESLQILHLSGNGMTGTIPDHNGGNDSISVSLQDLSLSHNQLTGSIPLSVQQHQWTSLDLSYNKLTGTLKEDVFPFDAAVNDDDGSDSGATLSLQVNRLSGPVPSALWTTQNISILDGNLFSCLFDRSDLPKHDPDASVYECGSNSFNSAVYVWLIFAVVMGVCAVLLWMTRLALKREHSLSSRDGSTGVVDVTESIGKHKKRSRKTTLVYVSEHITAWQQAFTPHAHSDTEGGTTEQRKQRRSLIALGFFVTCVRAAFLRLTLFIVLFLMPLFALLTHFYNTYTYEYAWTLSTSYLSGITAGVVMLLLLILFLVLCFSMYSRYYYEYIAAIGPYSLINIASSIQKKDKWPLLWYTALSLVAALNVILVMAVNVGYVYVIITYSGTIVRVTQVSLAAFKLGWNSAVLRKMLKWTKRYSEDREDGEDDVEVPLTRMSENQDDVVSQSTLSNSSVSHRTSRSAVPAQHIGVEVCLVLFNNIAAPIIATLFVSSNCFYNVIVEPPQVQVTYAYAACGHWTPHAKLVVCDSYGSEYRETSYSPPFTYSYQCSSTIVTYYAAIYVFMLLFIGFLVPAAQCGVKLVQQLSDRRGRVYAMLNHLLPILMRSRKKDHPLPAEPTQDARLTAADRSVNYSSDNSSHSLSLLRLLNASIVDLDADVKRLFECDLFIVRLINLLAILLTFGTVFPPLAIVVCVALFNFSYYTQILIGRFINVAHSKGHMRVSELLAQQCDNAALMFAQSVWIVVPFAVLFYSLFVLDTLGDDNKVGGWKAAVWAPVVLCVAPFVIWLIQTRGRGCCGGGDTKMTRKSSGKSEEEVVERFTGLTETGDESGPRGASAGYYAPVEDTSEAVFSTENSLLNRFIVTDDV